MLHADTLPRLDEALERSPPVNGEHEMTMLGALQDNCEGLGNKLTAFESAWHILRLACSQLSADLTLARGFTLVRYISACFRREHGVLTGNYRVFLLFPRRATAISARLQWYMCPWWSA